MFVTNMKNMLLGIVLLHSESGSVVLMVKKHHNNAEGSRFLSSTGAAGT
jgi:hypothetical protein